MTQRSGLFALFFVLFAPTNGFTQEEGEETLEECPIWERYTLPEATSRPSSWRARSRSRPNSPRTALTAKGFHNHRRRR